MSEPTIAQAVTATSADDGRKVFVGNLPFGTKADNLKEHFADKGTITDAQIIYRGRKPAGYGFVAFETVEQAAGAISSMDKTEFNGRVINCEIAKPPSSDKRGRIASEAAQAAGGEESTADYETTGVSDRGGRRGRGRGRGRTGTRGPRRPTADGEAETSSDMPVLPVNGTEGLEHAEPTTDGARGSGRRGRGGRRDAPRRGAPTGPESKTLLFVANLPFSVDDDGLKGIFEGCHVTSAHVVTRKFGFATGKSKGYGFVDFASEEDQKKALQNYNEHEIEGRAIQVKVAIEPQPDSEVVAS